jgi:hypothetical protein
MGKDNERGGLKRRKGGKKNFQNKIDKKIDQS